MYENQAPEPVLDNFEVERVFEDRPHERYAFTFKIEGDEFKGHFHKEEIQWLHPHPKQLIGEDIAKLIETAIHKLMKKAGILEEEKYIEVKAAFEDRPHECYQFTMQVDGEEFKGLIHKGKIQWFHPQPQQKLEEEQVQALESQIQEELDTTEDMGDALRTEGENQL
ncbi:hypothetical protein AB1K83_02295 [Sporosarcina sp. 179-K 3D1 HS]|uniref:hypothetical protein n=1 Tax=Sporosarcina sp. 179-K 3D1 HS TaxID=3232169 RepID=UPI0039A0EB31